MKMFSETMDRGPEFARWIDAGHQMLRAAARLILHPGAFFGEMPAQRGYARPILFLFLCSLIHATLAGLCAGDRFTAVGGIALVNAFLSPFLLSFLLYGVTRVWCGRIFSFGALLRILAYGGVTLLVAWIPGTAWAAGLWMFFLVGLGMVKTGGISPSKAFAALACTILLFLLMVAMMRSLAGTP
jgi:hypothetical protein